MTKRSQAGEGVALVECINQRLGKWRVRWDLQPYTEERDGVDQPTTGVNFLEKEFLHKPTLDEIKQTITDWMNSEIDRLILEGFVWNGMPVWLSTENQFNYKSAYDLAVMSGGQTLPVTFKFGTTDSPVYHEFGTLEELSEFYVSAVQYVSDTLAAGWARKDAYDWSTYEQLL